MLVFSSSLLALFTPVLIATRETQNFEMATPLLFQSLGTRIAVLTCFWAALLLSIPSWLRLTTIERLPLPTRQVEALQLSHKCPVTFASSLTVLVDPSIVPQDYAEGKAQTFLGEVEQLVQQSLELKAQLPAAASLECTRWSVGVRPIVSSSSFELFDPETGAYVVQVLQESPDSEASHQTSLPTVYLPVPDQTASLPLVPDTISAAVIAELLALRGDKPLSLTDDSPPIADTEQDPRVIQYSKHVRLVFSIMNQDVADGTAYDSWLIHALSSSNVSDNPITELTRELETLHDFHVETQVQWFAPLAFRPTQEVLEEVVEREVVKEALVDEEVEVEVEVETEAEDQEKAEDDAGSSEEEQVEQELGQSIGPKRTKLVKQKRIVQVPRLERVVEQTRTPLPPRHVVEWDDLKVFVNSEEWSLTSTVPPASSGATNDSRPYDVLSQTHDLHFLLYIPSRSYSPLLIRDPVGGGVDKGSNAWLIPQWGGVVILNVATEAQDGLVAHSATTRSIESLPDQQVVGAITLFARQLELLLGLSPSLNPFHRRTQLSLLHQRRILELTRETTATLLAITRLVSRIENLGVGPHVKADVQSALDILTSLPRAYKGTGHPARGKACPRAGQPRLLQPRHAGPTVFPRRTQVRRLHAALCAPAGAVGRDQLQAARRAGRTRAWQG